MRKDYPHRKIHGVYVPAVLALWTLVGLFAACDSREPNEYASPESAAYAMFGAMEYIEGDPQSAWAFLGPDTRARLELLAEEGPEDVWPTDYLRFGWLPDEALVRSIKRIETSGRTTRLAIETELDDYFELEMMRVGRGWQVEIGPVASTVPARNAPDDDAAEDAAPDVDDSDDQEEGP